MTSPKRRHRRRVRAVVARPAVCRVLRVGHLGVVDRPVEDIEFPGNVDAVDHEGHVAFPLGEVRVVALHAVLPALGGVSNEGGFLLVPRFIVVGAQEVRVRGGVAALAALIAGRIPVEGRCTVVVCSGGNVDADTYKHCIGVN